MLWIVKTLRVAPKMSFVPAVGLAQQQRCEGRVPVVRMHDVRREAHALAAFEGCPRQRQVAHVLVGRVGIDARAVEEGGAVDQVDPEARVRHPRRLHAVAEFVRARPAAAGQSGNRPGDDRCRRVPSARAAARTRAGRGSGGRGSGSGPPRRRRGRRSLQTGRIRRRRSRPASALLQFATARSGWPDGTGSVSCSPWEVQYVKWEGGISTASPPQSSLSPTTPGSSLRSSRSPRRPG